MSRTGLRRWLRFNVVGIGGFAVQMLVLTALVGGLGAHHLTGTFLAVEAAVLHNFAWHERWTWADRDRNGSLLGRLGRFHAANGAVSLAGNMALMWWLVDKLGAPYLPAAVAAVGVCSIVNFVAGDRFVFAVRRSGRLRPLRDDAVFLSSCERNDAGKA